MHYQPLKIENTCKPKDKPYYYTCTSLELFYIMRSLISSRQSRVMAIKLKFPCHRHLQPFRKPHEFSFHAYENSRGRAYDVNK